MTLRNVSKSHLQTGKHICLWDGSHRKLTGDWQEGSLPGIKAAGERRACSVWGGEK